MIIKSVSGKILYKSGKRTVKGALEEAAVKGISLTCANLRRCRLSYARLDGLKAPGACFWGAVLDGCELSGANLRGADFRNSSLKDACLAESRCRGADFSGAYFSSTILRDANMASAIFSTPEIFNCDLRETPSITHAIYRHLGEVDIAMGKQPVIIKGLSRNIVILKDCILWGGAIIKPGFIPFAFRKECSSLCSTIGETPEFFVYAFCKPTYP